jgi:tetratricopeptide (TPR) repeat protein
LNRRGNSQIALDMRDAALASYDAALAIEPGHHEVLNNRSVVLLDLGRTEEALNDCDRALTGKPDYADALYNRGNALMALGRVHDAADGFQAALAIEPRRVDALNNLGLALLALKRPAEALAQYDRALGIDSGHLGALHNRANALSEIDLLEEALVACDKVLAADSGHVDTLNTRGIVLGKLKRYGEALEHYEAALAAAPDRIDIENNCGTALIDLDRFDDAVSRFDRILAREPDHVGALINRGNAFVKLKRPTDALANYDKAAALDPDNAAAISARGVALTLLDRYEEALPLHDRALALNPELVAAHINRGNALVGLTRMREAIACYDKATALEPDNAEAHFNASITRLCAGDLSEGWKQYEYRWKKKDIAAQRPDFPQPIWRGDKDLHGKTVVLLGEQGFGDTIQFMRYAPMVAELGAKVILGVQPPLTVLATTLPGVSTVLAYGDALPEFDCYCPLLSLPLAFKTELATIPANTPYLWPHPERVAAWRNRLPDNGRLRVGLCWAGNPAHLNDRNRSMPLVRLAEIVSMPGLDFVSVQKEVSEAHAAMLRDHNVPQLGGEFADFADTAAVVAMLDLVVTVDTSVAHIAGAMGKAVALLLPFSPDWRWLLHRTDSPWYPSMRLFRQTAIGDWNGPLDRLRAELAAVAHRPAKASG